jgi:hypothetical protein
MAFGELYQEPHTDEFGDMVWFRPERHHMRDIQPDDTGILAAHVVNRFREEMGRSFTAAAVQGPHLRARCQPLDARDAAKIALQQLQDQRMSLLRMQFMVAAFQRQLYEIQAYVRFATHYRGKLQAVRNRAKEAITWEANGEKLLEIPEEYFGFGLSGTAIQTRGSFTMDPDIVQVLAFLHAPYYLILPYTHDLYHELRSKVGHNPTGNVLRFSTSRPKHVALNASVPNPGHVFAHMIESRNQPGGNGAQDGADTYTGGIEDDGGGHSNNYDDWTLNQEERPTVDHSVPIPPPATPAASSQEELQPPVWVEPVPKAIAKSEGMYS